VTLTPRSAPPPIRLPARGDRPSLGKLFDQAVQRHRAGDLERAEPLYREVLTCNPRHADSLNLIGEIAYQRGDFDTAAHSIGAAIAIDGQAAAYHCNLGVVRAAQGRLEDATAAYQRALSLAPDYAEVLNNLGAVFQAQGKLDEAAKHYEEALVLKPDYVEAHYNLGLADAAAGRTGSAQAHLERALALKPDHAEAHNNLGAVLRRQDRKEEAEAAFGRALALKPSSIEALTNLADLHLAQGKFTSAAAGYERVLALRPDLAAIHNRLGAVRQNQGRLDDAEECYGHALARDPDDAEAHNNLGLVLQFRGKLDLARERFERALSLRPDEGGFHYNRAAMKTFRTGDPDLATLERLAADPADRSPENAHQVHFALAKALEDTGDHARAFAHLLEANALKRSILDYDEQSERQMTQRIAEVFDAGLFDRLGGEGDPSARPIFVIGMPRSGSTLVEQILASHPAVHGGGELRDLTVVSSKVLASDLEVDYPDYVPLLSGPALRRLAGAYLDRLPKLSDGETRITDKLPGNFQKVGLIRLILPNARIVHTVRDPVDTCLSCFSKRFAEGMNYSYDLAELGRYYRMYNKVMDHWRSVLPPGAFLDVAYEAVVDDLEGQARRLVDYCGLTWDKRCLRFHETTRPVQTASTLQVRQPIFRSSLGRWRAYEDRLEPLLCELGDLVTAERR
jgi:tetratricopeptide (TPR) repeat protein